MNQTVTEKQRLKAILTLNGFTSFEDFANKHGFNRFTVLGVVDRYWGKLDKHTPTGYKTNNILNTLKQYVAYSGKNGKEFESNETERA